MRNVLLHVSGSPFVGLHLAESLCERAEVERVFLVAPGPGDSGRPGRLPHPADCGLAAGAKLRVLAAGLPPYRPGATAGPWEELAGVVDTVLYCAERQRPAAGLDDARALYVEPLKTWVAFLAENRRVRLGFLSTAFVAGARRGLFTEFDLDCGQSFRDPWERCMFEAERLLRGSAVSERVTVFRPSHVVGDARDGHAHAFGGLYDLLRLLRRGGLRLIAGDAQSRLDIVPVNYVADAVLALSGSADSAGKNFHLVGGWQGSTPLTDFVGLVTSHGRGGARKVFLAPPALAGLLSGLTQPAVFDDYLARAALESKEILCAPLDSYLGKVIQFAEECGWQPAARGGAEPGAGRAPCLRGMN
jgi:nucleoside-diphosphate-sugar epimerase